MAATRGSRCANRQDEKSPRSAAANKGSARGMPARRIPPGLSPAPCTRRCGALGWCGTLIACGEAFPESAVHGPSFPAAAILPCRLQRLPALSRLHSGDAPGIRSEVSQRSGSANRAKESRAEHAIFITISRVNKIRHIAQKKMRASHHDARSVTCMPRFCTLRSAFTISEKMVKRSANYRAESGGTGR